MTSFAASVKKELTMLEVHPMHARAELSAFVRMNGSLRLVGDQISLDCSTENAAIARRVYQLITHFFETPSHLVVRRKMKLKKNNVYIVRVNEGADNLLSQLGIFTEDGYQAHAPDFVMRDEQSQRSYLRGAFLAAGSVNSPETSRYHLEIRSVYEEHNDDLVELMNNFDLNARPLERKNHWITYLKESEKISDFLALTGATNSMLRFEDTRIVRDMRNSVNRLVNCENANLNKTAQAASKQISNIHLIEETIGLDSLDEKSRELAYLRLDHPEASLKELGEKVANGPISKSGVNHRMRKINQTADRIRKKASPES